MLQIHKKIEQARLLAGLTQEELAEKIGVERSTYSYWEQKTPKLENIYKVATALKVPIASLFDENFGKISKLPSSEENTESILLLSRSNDRLTETNATLVSSLTGYVLKEKEVTPAALLSAAVVLARRGVGILWQSEDEGHSKLGSLIVAEFLEKKE